MPTVTPTSLPPPARDREPAWITHLAWTEVSHPEVNDAAQGVVRLGLEGREIAYALDSSTGEPHDGPAPQDLFCAAVAAGTDSIIRSIAARMRVLVERLAVIVTGDVDARGALGDPDAPVAFQSMRVEVQLRLAGGAGAATARRLLAIALRQCVLLQTLRTSVPIEIVTDYLQ